MSPGSPVLIGATVFRDSVFLTAEDTEEAQRTQRISRSKIAIGIGLLTLISITLAEHQFGLVPMLCMGMREGRLASPACPQRGNKFS